MITEGLMQTGRWDLDLIEDCPMKIRRIASQLGALLIVSDVPLPVDGMTVTDLLGQSGLAYTGVVTRKANKLRRLSGAGLMWYLQSGKGYAYSSGMAMPALPMTFADFLTQWLSTSGSKSNQIGKGTAYSASATAINAWTVAPSFEVPPVKPWIDVLAAQTGNEYRITTQGYVDYGVATSLFRSTPNVVICEGLSGREADYRALDVETLKISTDVENYRNGAYYETSDTIYKAAGGATDPDTIYMFRMGQSAGYVTLSRPYAVLQTTSSTDVDNTVTAASNLYATPNYEIDCSVRDTNITTIIQPGDWVYVYSPDDDFFDTANTITVGGQVLNPKKIRCTGYTYPVVAGMGVYIAYDDVITDITNVVKWETGRSTQLNFDLRPKSLQANSDASAIG